MAREREGSILGGVVLASVALVLLAIGAAVALPLFFPTMFIKINTRPRHAECRTNLRSAYTAAKAYYGDHDKFPASFDAMGFWPEPGIRYVYAMSPRPVLTDLSTNPPRRGVTGIMSAKSVTISESQLLAQLSMPFAGGAVPGVYGSEFVAVCVGNIDEDATLDVWSISTMDRKASDGTFISAGDPHREADDTDF